MNKQPAQAHLITERNEQVENLRLGGNNAILGKIKGTTNYAEMISQSVYGQLYITTDDEITDWMLHPDNINVIDFRTMPKSTPAIAYKKNGWKKIVATTNKELWDRVSESTFSRNRVTVKGISKIDPSFIELYMKRWNEGKEVRRECLSKEKCYCASLQYCKEPKIIYEGNPITNVWLEIEGGKYLGVAGNTWIPKTLKLTSDGCVIIHPVEQNLELTAINFLKLEGFTNSIEGHSSGNKSTVDMLVKFAESIPHPVEERMYTREQVNFLLEEYGKLVMRQGLLGHRRYPSKEWFDKTTPE